MDYRDVLSRINESGDGETLQFADVDAAPYIVRALISDIIEERVDTSSMDFPEEIERILKDEYKVLIPADAIAEYINDYMGESRLKEAQTVMFSQKAKKITADLYRILDRDISEFEGGMGYFGLSNNSDVKAGLKKVKDAITNAYKIAREFKQVAAKADAESQSPPDR